MKSQRRPRLAVFIVGLAWGTIAATAAVETSEVAKRLQEMPPAHPRLFLARGAEAGLNQQIAANAVMSQIKAELLRDADRELTSQPVER